MSRSWAVPASPGAVTDAALDRGDAVTLFNRGRTNPGRYPQAETIIGDRTGDLTALSTRRADTPEDSWYGARKAAAEAIVAEASGDRSLIVRAGLIVGPNDATDRFAYWPRRIARGGRILAPGDPADPVQFIDATPSPGT